MLANKQPLAFQAGSGVGRWRMSVVAWLTQITPVISLRPPSVINCCIDLIGNSVTSEGTLTHEGFFSHVWILYFIFHSFVCIYNHKLFNVIIRIILSIPVTHLPNTWVAYSWQRLLVLCRRWSPVSSSWTRPTMLVAMFGPWASPPSSWAMEIRPCPTSTQWGLFSRYPGELWITPLMSFKSFHKYSYWQMEKILKAQSCFSFLESDTLPVCVSVFVYIYVLYVYM